MRSDMNKIKKFTGPASLFEIATDTLKINGMPGNAISTHKPDQDICSDELEAGRCTIELNIGDDSGGLLETAREALKLLKFEESE